MTPSETPRLVCSNHPGEQRIYLVESHNGDRVQCPECKGEWPNFLKYPMQEVLDTNTGELFLKNVITGERVE